MVKILIALYVFFIFFNPLSSFISYSNYFDEVLCITFIFGALIKIITRGGRIKKDDKFYVFLIILLISVIGFISNIVYDYMLDVSVIARDYVQTFKFALTFISATYLLEKYKNAQLKKYMILVSKIILTIFFIFGALSIFVDLGMGDSIRYGLRSYKFIYTHYTYLVFNVVLVSSVIMCENKKNIKYYIFSVFTLLATLRTKALMYIAIVALISIIFYFQRNKKQLKLKTIFKARYVIPSMLLIIMLGKTKILEYMSWGMNNSIRVGMHFIGAKIALKHFPLGTGFGTYGTNISYNANSSLYNIAGYGYLNYKHLLDYGYATISDVYWPSIYVQFGIIGCILFITSIIFIVRMIVTNQKSDIREKKAMLSIVLYIIVASVAEASFSNETGVFAPIVIAIMMSFVEKTRAVEKRN